jgi:predicted dehydrogenase
MKRNEKTVAIIGAGQLGSRHLQALKKVDHPLHISVIDPNLNSLSVAKQRYDEIIENKCKHVITYSSDMNELPTQTLDLAIVATNSNVRRSIIDFLLRHRTIKSVIAEKILFQRADDYDEIFNLIQNAGTDVRVNCSMRMMPLYKDMKTIFQGGRILYQVSGSQFGLVTNLIHYLDHMAYLTGCVDFKLNTCLLDANTIPSKREGFTELTGTVNATFADGSHGTFTCYDDGDMPISVQVTNSQKRYIVKETEGKAWVASGESKWGWQEIEAPIPFQSQMTRWIAEQMLFNQPCALVKYEESMKIHLQMLEPLRKFLNEVTNSHYDYYPFT